jgi:hypothetical protein
LTIIQVNRLVVVEAFGDGKPSTATSRLDKAGAKVRAGRPTFEPLFKPAPNQKQKNTMVLYNVTVTIDLDVQEDWLRWMQKTHIPDVMITGMFISYRLCRLIGHEHADAEIYTVQYLVQDMTTLLRYQNEFAPALQEQHKLRYDGKYAAYRSVMEVVDHNEKL